jgi:alpha-mannosidase
MNRREFLCLMSALEGLAVPSGLLFAADAKLDYQKIREKLSGMKLFIIPFSHVDWAWRNSRQWMVHRHSIVLSEALDLLKTTPEFRFYIENWNEQFDAFIERLPERVPEMRMAIQQGKIAVCGPLTNQHPSWMEAESYIRNLVMGRQLFQGFAPGVNLEIMTHDDVMPGPSQLPQILIKAGYRYYHVERPDGGLTAEGVPRDFVWVGPDGSAVLTSRGSVGGFARAESLPSSFTTNWEKAVETVYQREIGYRLGPPGGKVVWLGFGTDDTRPLRALLDGGQEILLPVAAFIREWNQREKIPLKFGTPIDFFHELEKEKTELPRHRGILDPCMWTFMYGRNGNQGLRYLRTQADQALVSGESFWSCAAALGESYPEAEYEGLWRDLLRVYSHAQMWLFEADYDAQLNRLKGTLNASKELRNDAARSIAERIKIKDDLCSVVLFNDLPWERTEVVPVWAELQDRSATNVVVRDAHGDVVPYQLIDINWYEASEPLPRVREANLLVLARVPALGYTTLYFEPGRGRITVPDVSTLATTLETEVGILAFSNRGIESFLDKQTGASYNLPGAIVFNEIQDTGPYHYGPVVKTYRWEDAKLRKVAHGPLRSSFVFEGALGPHQLVLTGHLYPHAHRLAFEARINSAGGSGHFMTTVGLPGPGKFVADTHFCVEDRDISRISYGTYERLRKNVFYGGHWVDYSDGEKGMTLIGSTGEKGYQLFPEENVLGHFLLMVVPPDPVSWERLVTKAQEGLGLQYFDYQLFFHSGDWKAANVVRRALETQHPILPVFANHRRLAQQRTLPEERSFLTLSPSTVQCSSFYRHKGRYLVRMYETSGSKASVSLELPFQVTNAKEVDFNGNPMPKMMSVSGKVVRFEVKPWEIVTVAAM